jgi:vacuolar-type H+-ATPase subunit H
MAGEVIQKIKKTENEASELVMKAHADAKRLLEKTREKKSELITDKDRLLEQDETRIRDLYAQQTKEAVREIEEEEKSSREKINASCEKHIKQVVSFITSEIVKE